MKPRLKPGPDALNGIRIGVARQQNHLKKHKTGCPDRRGPAKPRHDLFGYDGLNQKQQKA